MFAFARASSSPDLRFSPLGGIVVSSHEGMQQVQRSDIARGLDSVGGMMRTAKDVEVVVWFSYGANEKPKLACMSWCS